MRTTAWAEKVVAEARKIRRSLVARRPKAFKCLLGDCGLASLLLAERVNDVSILVACEDHAWTEVDGVTIDITATQFDRSIRGVYVGPRLDCHDRIIARGKKAAREILSWDAYKEEHAYPRLRARFG